MAICRWCAPGFSLNPNQCLTIVSNTFEQRMNTDFDFVLINGPKWPGGVLPYIGYTGMCRWKVYGFQAIQSGIGSSNHKKVV